MYMTMQQNPSAFTDKFKMNPADYAYQSISYARSTLMAGFTTVRDVGVVGGSTVNISMRNAINKGIDHWSAHVHCRQDHFIHRRAWRCNQRLKKTCLATPALMMALPTASMPA